MTDTYYQVLLKMKKQSEIFGNHLEELHNLNAEVKKKTSMLLHAIMEMGVRHKSKCSICVNNEPTSAFLPCGHGGFCEACALRGQTRNRCFTCRAEIETIVKIFI